MSETKLYTITEAQAEIIREALSSCDGDWWIAVRREESGKIYLPTKAKEFDTLFGSDGTHVTEGIEGVEIALCFGSETTKLGDFHKVLECSEIRGIRIQQSSVTDLTSLKNCSVLKTLVLTRCESLVDISSLSSLTNLQELTIDHCFKILDISSLRNLQSLEKLKLTGSMHDVLRQGLRLKDISAIGSLIHLQELTLISCQEIHDFHFLTSLHKLKNLFLAANIALNNVSFLSQLQSLQRLYIIHSPRLIHVPALSKLHALQELQIIRCSSLSGIPVLNAPSLRILNLKFCPKLSVLPSCKHIRSLEELDLEGHPSRRFKNQLIDISAISVLTKLKTLHLKRSDSIEDISVVENLRNLENLTITGCSALKSLPSFQKTQLTKLKTISLSGCTSISTLEPLESISTLEEIDASNCSSLIDIQVVSRLPSLTSINLQKCTSLADVSVLSSLPQLVSLSISGCSQIKSLPKLHAIKKLISSTCISLTDTKDLVSMQKIEYLELNGCSKIVKLPDLHVLQYLTNLDISRCSSLQAVPKLPNTLTDIKVHSCASLCDIKNLSFQTLENLDLSQSSSLVDITPLQNLNLVDLNLSECVSIKKVVIGPSVVSLHLQKCTSAIDLDGIVTGKNLTTINLEGCHELADNRTWAPLTKLPSLKEIKGSFPSYFTTKIFARNAANDRDWEYIQKNLETWIQTAESSPTEPNLLTQVGRACTVHPNGYESLAHIISLSTTNDAPEIDELFATSVPLASQDIIGSAIQSAVDQSEPPLPPETLVALHNHLPNNTTLRDNTIVALTRSISQDKVPEWGEKTAKALREELNDTRYPITYSVHDDGLSVLANQQFTPIQIHFFGVLCSGHARSTDIEWRNHFHNLLCGLALSQADTSTRNQALSDISSGLAICGDAEWVQNRLDYLLKAAAEIDPDTSVIYAAVAHAHAIGGRWDEAQETVSGIASPTVRDASLNKLCTMVLESSLPDKMQRSISFVNALSEPMERAQKLYELGFHDGLLADLVAYGQLVGLLTEFPEKQKEVVAHITEKKPEMVDSPIQTVILNAQAKQWLDLIQRVAPEQYKAILSEYARNPF